MPLHNPDLIVQVDLNRDTQDISVIKVSDGKYNVVIDGVIRHPNSGPEDVMRVLGHYLQLLSHKVDTLSMKGN